MSYPKFRAALEKIAEGRDPELLKRVNHEDFNPSDMAGGNFDDAFEAGRRAGAAEAGEFAQAALDAGDE